MSAIACALRHRSRDVIDELVLHIAETGGRTIVTERAVIVWYPTYTHTLIFSAEPRDVATLLDALTSLDAGDRWNAVNELADWWREPGVLGRIAVAVLDPHVRHAAVPRRNGRARHWPGSALGRPGRRRILRTSSASPRRARRWPAPWPFSG